MQVNTEANFCAPIFTHKNKTISITQPYHFSLQFFESAFALKHH